MIKEIEGLRRWVKCGFTKTELAKMSKEDVKAKDEEDVIKKLEKRNYRTDIILSIREEE